MLNHIMDSTMCPNRNAKPVIVEDKKEKITCQFEETSINSKTGKHLSLQLKQNMKSKIISAVVIAVVALTSLPMEVSAQNRNPVPTLRQNQAFQRLNAQLRRLKPGDARAISIARRMINLVPTSVAQVMSLATRKVVTIRSAQVLADMSIQVLGTFNFTPSEVSTLIVRSVTTVSNVAQTIPSIVASSPDSTTESTDQVIRGSAVQTILADPNLSTVVEEEAIPQIQPSPTATPTPTPTPYGA